MALTFKTVVIQMKFNQTKPMPNVAPVSLVHVAKPLPIFVWHKIHVKMVANVKRMVHRSLVIVPFISPATTVNMVSIKHRTRSH